MRQRLPILLSVPHAGLEVPAALAPYCRLTHDEIVADGDVGADAIYALSDAVAEYTTTLVARAVLDMNRARDDRRKDGVVKTHTCWDVPIWNPAPDERRFRELIDREWGAYHAELTRKGARVSAAFDCHTMAAFGPPVGPDAGVERPAACLSDGDGTTCPGDWIEGLRSCLTRALGGHEVAINRPFKGGYITRTHAREVPWIQIELSRAPYLTAVEKRAAVLAALTEWCEAVRSHEGPGDVTIEPGPPEAR